MRTGSEARSAVGQAVRNLGPSGIALIFVAPLTLILAAYTLGHTPAPPVSRAVPVTLQITAQPSVQPSASTTTGAQVVAFLGDTYALGTGASDPSKSWAALVSAQKGWTEKNLSTAHTSYSTTGVPFETSYRSRLDALVATGAQIVVVSGGRNDVSVGATQFRADVRATFADIHTRLPKAKIIAVSPTWANDPAPARLIALIAIVRDEAGRAGATYLDIGEPMLGHADMVGANGWQPNDAGHGALAAAVEKALA